ncbi:MAG: DUF2007 domain-containing protein [Bacteroidales bacterium]|nr:DUF2007 domain-containing protein [Bacteroidales bacterium]
MNNDWTKIISFSSSYEAEIRKQLLTNAGIETVVINAKDSLFLLGEIDVYVHPKDEKKAMIILEQMQGLTKINSFILKKPIELFRKYLLNNGISTILKERANDKYILENYELYIENENIEQVVPFLTGQKIEDWTKVDTSTRVKQSRYRVELLEDNDIESFIIKKRDSDFHLEEISLYVQNNHAQKATSILSELTNWEKIRTYNKFETAELKEDILGRNKIRALIVQNGQEFDLFVKKTNVEKAEDILQSTKEWVEIQRYNTFLEAETSLVYLEENNIESSILTIRDSMFIIGGYALYVEKIKINQALEILTEAKGGTIIEE